MIEWYRSLEYTKKFILKYLFWGLFAFLMGVVTGQWFFYVVGILNCVIPVLLAEFADAYGKDAINAIKANRSVQEPATDEGLSGTV